MGNTTDHVREKTAGGGRDSAPPQGPVSIHAPHSDWPAHTEVTVTVAASVCTPGRQVALLVDGRVAGMKTVDVTGKAVFALVCLPPGDHVLSADIVLSSGAGPALPLYGLLQVPAFRFYGDIWQSVYQERPAGTRWLQALGLGEGI